MEQESRRNKVLEIIRQSQMPVSASFLAKELSVSRQVIVGDVALLRAQGYDIMATTRGYTIPAFHGNGVFLGKVACLHTPEEMLMELYTIVDLEGVVVNVIVEHNIYGELTGCLNLYTRKDVDNFAGKVYASGTRLLSELTGGIHLHTIACRDRRHFETIEKALEQKGYLLHNDD